ncbi:hypothetical protein GN956_G13528 [Arapaima gigas]
MLICFRKDMAEVQAPKKALAGDFGLELVQHSIALQSLHLEGSGHPSLLYRVLWLFQQAEAHLERSTHNDTCCAAGRGEGDSNPRG